MVFRSSVVASCSNSPDTPQKRLTPGLSFELVEDKVKTRGPWWPCKAHLSITALREPDLELIKVNILTKIHDDYINKSESNGLSVQAKKFNIDFQNGGHLGFPINNFSYFWSTSHLDTSNEVWVSCPFGSGKKVQNKFITWLLGQPSWISIRTILAISDLQVTPMLPTKFPYQVSSQLAFRFRMVAILDFK